MSDQQEARLDRKQIARLGAEGLLSLVPYVGSTLATFTFGTLTELRLSRIERTLSEVMESVGEDAAKQAVNEKFVNLLETVAPQLSRATDEEKRLRFRDLLINAAKLPDDSSDWGASTLAADLLGEIEAPGLAILAGLAQLEDGERALLTAYPVPQILRGVSHDDFDPENPGEPKHVIPFEWEVVSYWYRKLESMRLIVTGTHPKTKSTFQRVCLTDLGRFLVRWVVS